MRCLPKKLHLLKPLLNPFLGFSNVAWVFFINLIPYFAAAQQVMSAEQAVKIGLEKNYAIQILRNQEQIADNNNTKGRAGMLPLVFSTGGVNYGINNTVQNFFTGPERRSPSAATFNIRFGAEADWTVFNGFRMYVAKDRLTALTQQSRVQTTIQVQGLTSDILMTYYNIVQLERATENLEYAVRLDRDLLDLVQRKKTIGTATGLELLQSKSRFTSDSARLVQQRADIVRAHMAFNQLLNLPTDSQFAVDTTLAMGALPILDALLTSSKQANPSVLSAKVNRQLSMLSTKDVKGTFLPEVVLVGSANYTYQRNAVGVLLSNRNLGPQLGVTLRYTIYDGKNRTHNLENAKIVEENTRLSEASLLVDIEARIRTRYADYLANQQLSQLELANLKVAVDQANLARELYRLGKITNFEVRESTLQEIQARDLLIQAWYRLKSAEIDLLDLAGMLPFQ
jgi:outer membrane protein TolC